MHIIYIHQYFITPDKPGGTRSYEMAQRLIKAGHRVSMICGSSDSNYHDGKRGEVIRQDVDGIEVHHVIEPYNNAMGGLRRGLSWLRFASAALKIAKSLKDVDVVFATSTPLTVGDPGRKAAKYHRCPFIFEVRDLWPERIIDLGQMKNPFLQWYFKRMELRAYRAASACIALAPRMREGIAETGFPPEQITMVPNSCDTKLFIPSDVKTGIDQDARFGNPGDFRLIYTGALGIVSGLDFVIDTASILKRRGVSGVKICLVGSGGCKAGWVGRTKTENLEDFISWIDLIPKVTLAKLLPQADVGMMLCKNTPAIYNGTSPNKFFDYLSSGLPVLNNYPGWLADYIMKHNCGVVVPPDNPDAFADAIVDLMHRREELKEMGKNARKLAETVFDRDLLGQQFVQVFEKTVNDFKRKKYA